VRRVAPLTEQQLVAGLRAGRVDAFDAAYRAYRARVFSFLARLAGEPALAEDLLQETFIRLAEHAPGLAADTRVLSWLFTVARNLFISHKRWAVLDVTRVSEARLWASLAPEAPTPFALAAASESQRRLEEALAALPLAYREVVLLCAVEGLSPTEAAEVLGARADAVRQRLLRARAMLREQLDGRTSKP
jgi:RNA polymerase sigma factor (sigma-70 family)